MTTYSFRAADGEVPTATEVARYKNDTRRFKKNKDQNRRNLIKGHLASILNRMTLPNSTTSTLLAFSLFGLITHIYA
jgi:hypothetical protein